METKIYDDTMEPVVQKVYADSGVLLEETTTLNGQKHGIEKQYYESGLLKHKTSFSNGIRNGDEKLYNKSGVLIQKLVYEDGERVSAWHRKSKLLGILKTVVTFPFYCVKTFWDSLDGDTQDLVKGLSIISGGIILLVVILAVIIETLTYFHLQ